MAVRAPLLMTYFAALLLSMHPVAAQNYPDVESITKLREEYKRDFGKTGEYNSELAEQIRAHIRFALHYAPAGQRYGYLYELGMMQRIHSQYEAAIETLTAAADDAPAGSKIEFKSWTDVAVSHAQLTNHDAAAEALERAVRAAGPNPSRAERYEIAYTKAMMEEERGEYGLALASALDSLRFAGDDEEEFHAQHEVYNAIHAF